MYLIVIEFVRKTENSIADALSRLDSIAVDNKVLNDLARAVLVLACFVYSN